MQPVFQARRRKGGLLIFLAVAICSQTLAQNLDTIGVTLLQTVTANLNGTGIRVAEPEADVDTNPADPSAFEVNPAAVNVNRQVALFTYASTLGTVSATFPNSVGAESWHGDLVAGLFYGVPGGVATNVAHVDNYDTSYFYNSIVAPDSPNINDRVVNQSFIFEGVTVSQQQLIDSRYDNYADKFYSLFVSGAGNGGPVAPPSTCYNGIGVGALLYGTNYSSIGPTLDNGRAKPDITAPATATSFSTPQVAGAAAVLMQAAVRGDGGADTNSAGDMRTVKALLLNGAIKPDDWTNSTFSPLDARYGAGVLNVFNSYEQLAFGKHGYIVSASVATGGPHPPTGASGTISTLSGWDFNTNTSSASVDGVNHYYFNVTNSANSNALFTATATLVWNRQRNLTAINDLDLFLYDAISSNLVASSTSPVDNVEHIFVPQLPRGRYDLQVLKNGGASGKLVTASETYALAFEFFSMRLAIASSDTNAVITWPVYPAGFILQSTPNLNSPVTWSTNNAAPVVTNNLNQVTVDASSGNQFFRLRRP